MTDVDVRGGATEEELAAVVAVLSRRLAGDARPAPPDPLTRWRRGRQAVTRPTAR